MRDFLAHLQTRTAVLVLSDLFVYKDEQDMLLIIMRSNVKRPTWTLDIQAEETQLR